MSLGLGHKYFVRLVKHHCGDLSSCIKFMKTVDKTSTQWFELRNVVKVIGGKAYNSEDYFCDLVEDGSK